MVGKRAQQRWRTCVAFAATAATAFHVAPPLQRGVGHQWHSKAFEGQPLVAQRPAAIRRGRLCRSAPACVVATSQSVELSAAAPLAEILQTGGAEKQRFIFFGGKGGVGKTSTSAAAAVECADKGLQTLVISTDPAHSLGDALDQDVSGGKPVTVAGVENLWAMEVDVEAAIEEFRQAMDALDVAKLASEVGISPDLVQNLGLDEVSQILRNPPPGVDELVALAGVVRLAEGSDYAFDRIIIDTAPTGHTLRLLAFPDFLDNFLGKVVKLRSKLEGVLNLASTFLGSGSSGGKNGGPTLTQRMDAAVAKLDEFRERMVRLRDLFQNNDVTEFCVVAIPTTLATAESGRLLAALRTQKIAVRNVIVNQVVAAPAATAAAAAGASGEAAAAVAASAAGEAYLARLRRGQEASLKRLAVLGERPPPVALTRVPYFDVEVTGVYPLRYFGEVAFGGANAYNWADLMDVSGPEAPNDGRKFIILGGKGGVGKTSSSAALAIRLADAGHDTVVVSTDPAHSLGDALQLDLTGGKLTLVPGGLSSGGSLYALEVDTDGAVAEFKKAVDAFAKRAKPDGAGSGSGGGGGGGGGLLGQLDLEGFADVLDTAPPGTDELVALSKVLSLVRGNNELGKTFDRIVIDTAPTGHTLRMLSFPQFLDDFFERLIRVRNRFKGASAFLGMFSGGGGGGVGGGAADAEADAAAEEADRDRLRDLQFKMMELQELFRDDEQSEFVVVTIPTELAAAESERLVTSLRNEGVPVKHMVINKVVSEAQQQGYLERLAKGQAASLGEMARLAEGAGAKVTRVPYFDTEVRGVYGLRAMAASLFRPKAPK